MTGIIRVKSKLFLKKTVTYFLLTLVIWGCGTSEKKETPKVVEKPKPNIQFGYNFDNFKVIQDTIKSGESFGEILDRHHVFYPTINKIAATVKEDFDVRRVRAGKPYTILASKDSLEKAQVFIYKHDKINATILDFKDSIIRAEKYSKPIKIIEKEVSGVVYNNFSEAMDSLGILPSLTYEVADIYAWTLDFYRLQRGDSFKIIYEEKFIDDSTFAGYGTVKQMVFNHKSRNLYAFRFIADSIRKIPDYYDDEGDLLRRQFLTSPIKFQYRISS